VTLRGANVADEFKALVEDHIAKRYGGADQPADAAE
jgi:hypothetical protein